MPTKEEWSRAFAKQARADFETWNALKMYLKLPKGSSPLPQSQKLHFLQMACEKLAKAHLLKGRGAEVLDLEQSHAYIAKHLPTIVRQQMILSGEKERVANSVRDQCKRLAREIDLLAPSVKAGGKREDNCEYPWEQGGKLYIPAEWPFTNLDLLTAEAGRNILKRIQAAINRLAS
jgi:hypothetical protein